MDWRKNIDWMAMICGVIGSGLVALPSEPCRFAGFVLFLLGDLLWIAYGYDKKDLRAVVALNIIYFFTSCLGVWSNCAFLFLKAQ